MKDNILQQTAKNDQHCLKRMQVTSISFDDIDLGKVEPVLLRTDWRYCAAILPALSSLP